MNYWNNNDIAVCIFYDWILKDKSIVQERSLLCDYNCVKVYSQDIFKIKCTRSYAGT